MTDREKSLTMKFEEWKGKIEKKNTEQTFKNTSMKSFHF